jgi:drug/metabolite transporter (DMT)-like permease
MGKIYALGAAIIWAFSVILFKKSGESVHPIALNAFKSTLGMVLVLLTLWFSGKSLWYSTSWKDYALLLCSGVIGIAVADSLIFKGLNLLGAGLAAIVNCTYSPFIILLSVLFIGESLGQMQILGVLLIISAVLTATSPRGFFKSGSSARARAKSPVARRPKQAMLVLSSIQADKAMGLCSRAKPEQLLKHPLTGRGPVPRHDLILGTVCGILAMALMAISIVMVKPLLDRSPVLWATEIRLIGGCLGIYIHLMIHPQGHSIVKSTLCARSWKYTVWGSFLGGYVAMLMWIGGMKYTQASTAAALNQTTNIFVFLFAAWFLKERITWLRLGAICAAVLGALLVTFG